MMRMDVDAPAPLLPPGTVVKRRDLSNLIRQSCRDAGAAHYLLMETASDNFTGASRILVSSWMFDMIEDVGHAAIGRLAENPISTAIGTPSRGWHPVALAALLTCEDIAKLTDYGHHELFLLKLSTGRKRFSAIISAGEPGLVSTHKLGQAQLSLSYLLSRLEKGADAQPDTPLSERERECLFWVSEGKTADDIALILDVSVNTINSYVSQAVQKLSATNRAMAIATAIRKGMI